MVLLLVALGLSHRLDVMILVVPLFFQRSSLGGLRISSRSCGGIRAWLGFEEMFKGYSVLIIICGHRQDISKFRPTFSYCAVLCY